MSIHLDIVKYLKLIAARLLKVRGFLIALAIIGLVGYAGYLISRIVDLQPDQAYLASKRQEIDKTKINFDKKTIQTINNLKQINPTVDLSNVGKSDPFAP